MNQYFNHFEEFRLKIHSSTLKSVQPHQVAANLTLSLKKPDLTDTWPQLISNQLMPVQFFHASTNQLLRQNSL